MTDSSTGSTISHDAVQETDVDEVDTEQNICFETVKMKQLPTSNLAVKINKTEIGLIALVALLMLMFVVILALVSVAYVRSNETMNQLNTLQKELKQIQNGTSKKIEELKQIQNGNSENIYDIQNSLISVIARLEEVNDQQGITMIASNITQHFLDNLVPLLVNAIQAHHVFNSCEAVMNYSLPFTSNTFLIRSSNNSSVSAHCASRISLPLSCNGQTGRWRRVAYLDPSDAILSQCPSGFETIGDPPSCRRNVSDLGCSSVIYQTQGRYHCIFGRIMARQTGTPDAFQIFGSHRQIKFTIDENYVDGASLTYGKLPRNHIWTFAAGIKFDNNPGKGCSVCSLNIPSQFIGSDYSCEVHNACIDYTTVCGDILWDGDQCVGNSTFYRQLPQSTTDGIELRVCRDQHRSDEDILITLVEIYVQ